MTKATRKRTWLLVQVSTPVEMRASQTRREVRDLITHQCNWMADEGDVKALAVKPAPVARRSRGGDGDWSGLGVIAHAWTVNPHTDDESILASVSRWLDDQPAQVRAALAAHFEAEQKEVAQ